MTYGYMGHDSFFLQYKFDPLEVSGAVFVDMCVILLMDMWDMTYGYMRHDSFFLQYKFDPLEVSGAVLADIVGEPLLRTLQTLMFEVCVYICVCVREREFVRV